MPDFPFDPQGYTTAHGWRPLKKVSPYMRGWDCFDLQCKLAYLGHSLDTDGIFGPQTDDRVRVFQAQNGLVVDGIAGVATQTLLGAKVCGRSELPKRIRGQMEKESSLLCGIYTAPYSNGSTDRGPVQMNSKYYPEATIAFDVRSCVPALVHKIKDQHDKYVSWGVADDRAWTAAQGSWNSPAYADKYAKGQSVPESFLAYVAACTAYV